MTTFRDFDNVSSILTAGKPYPISQLFAENSPDVPDDWYGYATSYGLQYGEHPGLDIATPFGTPIYAIADGTVTQSGLAPYFRPYPVYQDAKTKTGEPIEIIYGHFSKDVVTAGQSVHAGDLLGYSGAQSVDMAHPTEYNSGPHVHLEIRKAGKVVDPISALIPGGVGADTPAGMTIDGVGGNVPSSGKGTANVGNDAFMSKFGLLASGVVLAVVGIVFVSGKV